MIDINQINHQLSKISKGQLDEEVSINNSLEFQKLSHYINEMKQSLLVNNKKNGLYFNFKQINLSVL